MGHTVVIGPKLPGTILNPPDGRVPNGSGQSDNGMLGEVISPIAEIIFPVRSVINCPWLSSIKYTHSPGLGPPFWNTVSNVPPVVTGKE